MKRLLISVLLAGVSALSAAPAIWILGDSTTARYNGKYLPRAGWGVGLEQWVKPDVRVENYGRGGRSTRSYLDEGHFALVLRRARKGDFAFIQFGHNDGKKDIARLYAPADGAYRDNLRLMVSRLREKGIHPIIVTPVSRCSFRDGKIYNSLSDYPQAARAVAAELRVPLVDLNAISTEKLAGMGEEKALQLYMVLKRGEHPNYPDGLNDRTHFRDSGAVVVASWVVVSCREQKLPVAELFREPGAQAEAK